MPEKIEICNESGIVYIHSHGVVTERDLSNSLNTVIKLSEGRTDLKILVDAREQASLPSTTDLYYFAQRLSEKFHRIRHAIVASNNSPNDLSFIKTVSMNRGAQMQIFADIDSALLWLKS